MADVDLLVCGSCTMTFPLGSINSFMNHKKQDCEYEPARSITGYETEQTGHLVCQSCLCQFRTPIDLLHHVQREHNLDLFSWITEDEEPSTRTVGTDPLHLDDMNPKEVHHPSQGSHNTAGLQTTHIAAHTAKIIAANPHVIIDAEESHVISSCSETSPEKRTRSVQKGDSTVDAADKESHPTVLTSPESILADRNAKVVAEAQTLESQNITNSSGQLSDVNATGESSSRAAADAESTSGPNCCNDQDCGVTVMPGTHESLKKCCSAVVPKKRKRHMETKHTCMAKSKRRAQSSKSLERSRYSTTHDIFIDVNPEAGDGNSLTVSTSNERLRDSHRYAEASPDTSRDEQDEYRGENEDEEQSFISTLSIPVSSSTKLRQASQRGSMVQPQLPTASNTVTASATLGMYTSGQSEMGLHDVLSIKSDERVGLFPNDENQSASQDGLDPTKGMLEDNQDDSDSKLAKHKKRRYPTSRPYKCDQCDHAFNQRIHLKKHQSKHTGIKPFKCSQCDYSTVERSHLKVHIRVHTGEKPFKCTDCEYATAQNSTLKIHLQRHHNKQKTTETAGSKKTPSKKKGLPPSGEESMSPINTNELAAMDTDSAHGDVADPNVKPEAAADAITSPEANTSGMTMTVDNHSGSITFRGNGLEEVLALLSAERHSSDSSTPVTNAGVVHPDQTSKQS